MGYGVYFINGEKITDNVLITHFTQYDKTVLYNIFDVTDFINVGKNAIAAHLGNGPYNDATTSWNCKFASWRSNSKLIAELKLEYVNGELDFVCTDS